MSSGNQESTEDSDDAMTDELYCLACDKMFASVKAKLNHEASKKHKKQLSMLRQVLEEQDLQTAHLDEHVTESGETGERERMGKRTEEVKLTKRAKKAQKRRKKEEERQQDDKVNMTSKSPDRTAPAIPEDASDGHGLPCKP